ncbi:hypothetical protein [Bradyrhizobium sp. CCBAU 51753]|uniref:hypothetical protein n=1 Tax=Bradyrhizobium sp. CCBAU 51753 TaxID=1325100 RepID=UPI00188C8A12|nr:hypothetical protein [Bradyrhizobium sp. CCBAU 51753]
MSFQLTVLKVLAGQPAGRASVAEVRDAVEILMNSGKDWTDRMKRLAEHAPDLNIFSAKFVVRDPDGWEITEEGRQFLAALQTAVAIRRSPLRPVDDPPTSGPTARNAMRLSDPPRGHRRDGTRRRRGKGRSNRRTT